MWVRQGGFGIAFRRQMAGQRLLAEFRRAIGIHFGFRRRLVAVEIRRHARTNLDEVERIGILQQIAEGFWKTRVLAGQGRQPSRLSDRLEACLP